jgi:hypothetical protein
MAATYRVLGQNSPAANTATTLYTVPASRSAVCSTLAVCNQNSTTITFRVWVAIAGAADSTPQYLYYDVQLLKNSTAMLTIGMTLATTDLVRIQASATNVSFNLFGQEIS